MSHQDGSPTGKNAEGPTTNAAQQRRRLLAAHQVASEYFHRELRAARASPPRIYLQRRGFVDVIDNSKWLVGYAPPGWTGLTSALRSAGFTDAEVLASGLGMTSSRGTLIDRFRDRITFGIRHPEGAVVAFTARCGPHADRSCPKYLNSPQTALYHKSRILFGLAEQRNRLAAGATPVLVEGPLDAIAAASAAGADFAVVSPCGTALSDAQAAALRRHSGAQVIVAFDPDPAGARSASAAYAVLRRHFDQLLHVLLPEGRDPADLRITADPTNSISTLLQRPQPLADRVIDSAMKPWLDDLTNAEARVAALRSAASATCQLRPADVARQAHRIGQMLSFTHQVVTDELARALDGPQPPRQALPTRGNTPTRSLCSPFACSPFPQKTDH